MVSIYFMVKNSKANKPNKPSKPTQASSANAQASAEILQQPLEARKAMAQEAFLNGMSPKLLIKAYGLPAQAVYGMIGELVKVARRSPPQPPNEKGAEEKKEVPPETPPQTPLTTPPPNLTNTPTAAQQNDGHGTETVVEKQLAELTKLVAEDIRSRQPDLVVVDKGKREGDAEGDEEESGSPFAEDDGGKGETTQTVQLEMTTMGQRIVNNPKNILYYNFAKKRWPKWGSGADFSEFVSDCIHFFMSEHNIEIEVRERIR